MNFTSPFLYLLLLLIGTHYCSAIYYAVARGRQTGVYGNWADCKPCIQNFPGAILRTFENYYEATNFLTNPTAIIVGAASQVIFPKFETDQGVPIVYTDGSCKELNEEVIAGIGIFWGDNHPDNVSAVVDTGLSHMNNRAEYIAAIEAIKKAQEHGYGGIVVRTDCESLVSAMNKYIGKWKRNGWQSTHGREVEHRDLLEELDELRNQIDVSFEYVAGHSSDHGNSNANHLAQKATGKVSYYVIKKIGIFTSHQQCLDNSGGRKAKKFTNLEKAIAHMDG